MNGSKESTPGLQTAKQSRIAGVVVSEDVQKFDARRLATSCLEEIGREFSLS